MKSGRLLSALMLLQAHGRLSSRELAERLEISQRTAHRDMEALSAAGIPILALRGVHGGWELEKGWRTKVPGLDEAELRALLMAQPSALGDPRLIAAAERAFGKLMAAMPGSMRIQAASIRARLHIDPTGWNPLLRRSLPTPHRAGSDRERFKAHLPLHSSRGRDRSPHRRPLWHRLQTEHLVSGRTHSGRYAHLPCLTHIQRRSADRSFRTASKIRPCSLLEGVHCASGTTAPELPRDARPDTGSSRLSTTMEPGFADPKRTALPRDSIWLGRLRRQLRKLFARSLLCPRLWTQYVCSRACRTA
jgi:biotin operon repressor